MNAELDATLADPEGIRGSTGVVITNTDGDERASR